MLLGAAARDRPPSSRTLPPLGAAPGVSMMRNGILACFTRGRQRAGSLGVVGGGGLLDPSEIWVQRDVIPPQVSSCGASPQIPVKGVLLGCENIDGGCGAERSL